MCRADQRVGDVGAEQRCRAVVEDPVLHSFLNLRHPIAVQAKFLSQSKQITIDYFVPSKPGRYPIVCALHGSGGLANVGHLQFAQLLANQGFAVFVPHYFESTGTHWADNATIWREFPVWMQTISDALDFAERQPNVNPERIGVIGFSLGAYLALSLATQQKRVKAVVDFFGGMPDHFAEQLDGMPPVLILHGVADTVVPVTEAEKIAELLEKRGLQYEMKLYQNAGHGFRGFDMMDAGQRAWLFLRKNLA
jgi:dienelactone hydrolase